MYVCPNCFGDEELRNFIEGAAAALECDFCGARSDVPIAASLDVVADHIAEYLHLEYTDPADSGLPFDSGEGGYQGTTYSTEELLRDEISLELPRDRDGRLLDALVQEIDRTPASVGFWAEEDPFGLPEQEQLRLSWESFAEFVMHQRRFFFRHTDLPEPEWWETELLTPDKLLQQIGERAIDVGLIAKLSAGTLVYRARHQPDGAVYDTEEALGPPPAERARQNRMSPAGIPMFHAAEDIETAVAEVYREPGDYAVGGFVTTRAAWILDLHDVPAVPSYFSETHGWERKALMFLRAFATDISKPITQDGREHIEYAPTQVLTEYFRTQVRYADARLEGVSFTSSRTGRRNYTLFLLKDDEMRPEPTGTDRREALLRFEDLSVVRRLDR
ncbi:MAG TPA: HEPN-associated N-terminal domain-containing protein [bacterium]|nr:HEPN-associated N-terminal domain-containing protein [bacterium]